MVTWSSVLSRFSMENRSKEIDIEIGTDELLDEVPDDARHLVAVELDDRQQP